MSDLWFKRKKYGWGWTPIGFIGWSIIVAYVVLLSGYPIYCEISGKQFNASVFLPVALILTVALIAVSYAKGEKPQWQWGESEKDKNK